MSYFPEVEKINYEGPETKNMFAFRHYNAEEEVMGKKMKDHLRFAIAYWHTMTQDGSDPFGDPINQRTWFGKTPMETAKNRVEAFFEICQKLGAEYFCFHDVDIAPQGDSLQEFYDNLDEITDLINYGIQPICSLTRALQMEQLQRIMRMYLLMQLHKSKKVWTFLKN